MAFKPQFGQGKDINASLLEKEKGQLEKEAATEVVSLEEEKVYR